MMTTKLLLCESHRRSMIKSAAKKIVKTTYKSSSWLLPALLRNELEGYRRYRNDRHSVKAATAQLPYWERREKRGIVRKRVRIGFVGAGHYAQHHLRVLNSLDEVEIAAILTTGGAGAQAAAKKYGIKQVFADANSFFAIED